MPLESSYFHIPLEFRKQAWDDLHRLTQDNNNDVRWGATDGLGACYSHIPVEYRKQAWDDLHRLTQDNDDYVRSNTADALGSCYSYIPLEHRKQAWDDLHRLTQDNNDSVRMGVADALGSCYSHIPIEFRKQAWDDLIMLTQDNNNDVRWGAARALGAFYSHIPIEFRKQAWDDLHRLTQDNNDSVRMGVADALGSCYSHIPIEFRKQAWDDLHRLTQDNNNDVRWSAARALGSCYSYIPVEYRKQAWNDLHRLIQDNINYVRSNTADALGSCYSYIPLEHRKQAWDDLHKLTQDKDKDVRITANHSSGRVSIYRSSQAEGDESIKKELETALRFFEKSSKESTYFNPAKFCLPFYRSFYSITFKKEEGEAEVKQYLTEAKSAVEGSISKEKLLEAVENLGNALKEVKKARDLDAIKSDLNAYRRYCDRACELLDTTEEKAPGASRLIRKGLPIIDERIKGIISEIQEKAKALCTETRGTSFESLGKDLNNAGQNLINVRDPIGLEKQVQNMLIVLKSICTSMPEEERGDACEFLKNAHDEHYIEDKLSSINMVLSKIPTHIRKAIVMTKIEIKNSTNTQVTLGNGNIQKIGTSTKPEYGFDEPKKMRKITKSAISIDEKIQQNNASIEQILDNWGFKSGQGKRDEKKAEIKKWLHRFQLSEFEDAFLILERIQYYDNHAVDGYMEGLSRELKKVLDDDLSEILFYPLGESPASSGGNLLYSYRKELGLPESSFPYVPLKDIDLSGKKAIVFFDDIIGSGNQAVRFAENHLQDIEIDKYYVALMAFEKGLENVRNNGCFKKVIVHEIISEELRAFSPGSQIFPDADTRERIKRLCEKYGKLLYPKHPLGYDDSQALIVFPHNTPNNTLPIIWASDKNEKEPGYVWYPVWERIKRTEKK